MGRSMVARTRELLTFVAVGAWLASLVVRVLHPDTTPVFVSTDPVVLLIVGFWFTRDHHYWDGDGS